MVIAHSTWSPPVCDADPAWGQGKKWLLFSTHCYSHSALRTGKRVLDRMKQRINSKYFISETGKYDGNANNTANNCCQKSRHEFWPWPISTSMFLANHCITLQLPFIKNLWLPGEWKGSSERSYMEVSGRQMIFSAYLPRKEARGMAQNTSPEDRYIKALSVYLPQCPVL